MISYYFIRHGEADCNLDSSIISGSSQDSLLTAKGRKQARDLARCLSCVEFDKVFHSDAARARITCEEACTYWKFINGTWPETESSEVLREQSAGDWEGKNRQECYASAKQEMAADPYNFKAPKGESRCEKADKMENWFVTSLNDICITEATGDVNIAVFGHGNAFRCLFSRLFGIEISKVFNMRIDNCGICRLDVDDELNNTLVNWNFVYPDIARIK